MRYIQVVVAVMVMAVASVASADTVSVIDFEGFGDTASITNQYAGLTFSNTSTLTAGSTLDEFEFPPVSGLSVAFDDGGPMDISFLTPVTTVGGYFTYFAPLTIEAFDASGNLLGLVTSAFVNNGGLSGDVGSTPDEFLEITFASGISSVRITGDPAGGSFTLDNLTLTTASAAPVPEPSSFLFIAGGLLLLPGIRTRTS